MTIVVPDAEHAYSTLSDKLSQAIGQSEALLVGVHSGGAWIASRLAADLNKGRTQALGLGFLSSAFHRDDYAERGLPGDMKATDLPLSIDGADVILVDDILYTGRTVRAVLNELFDYGRPQRVRLAVLIDRGGRQLPIEAQFCGGEFEPAQGTNLQLEQSDSGAFLIKVV